MGYPTIMDTLNPRYTGKNRDSESSLDWFEIRSMSSAQGRFQSVDPGNAGASPGNPQTWNMYAYVTNNPLSYTDPSGMGFWSSLFDGSLAIGKWLANFATFGQAGQFWSGSSLPGLGGVNDGPWNEQLPSFGGPSLTTGGVCNGRGVGPCTNSLLPDGHWDVTFNAARAAGYGILDALRFANGVIKVDKNTQGPEPKFAHIHAMGGGLETTCQGYYNTVKDMQANLSLAGQGDSSAAYQVGHTIEDSYVHQYAYWDGGGLFGWPGGAHFANDMESPSSANRLATKSYLTDLRDSRLKDAAHYLAPPPVGCR